MKMRKFPCGLSALVGGREPGRRLRRLLLCALPAAGLLLLTSCSPGTSAQAKPDARPAAPITVATAVQTNVPVQVREIGHVNAFATVVVMSLVDGQLAGIHFEQGDELKEGQLIFEIDPSPYEAALHQAEGMLARDVALERKAELDVQRSNELFSNKIEAATDHEQTQANAAALKATLVADQAAVENAKLQLSYCHIHSPINGRAGKLLVNAGNIIKKQDSLLLVINQIKPIYVDFPVPERQLPEIRNRKAGGKLKVEARIPGQEHSSLGELMLINNAVDTNSGNIFLRAVFPNLDEMLWPGQFVEATLTLTVRSNRVVVPAQAVQDSQNGETVFVVQPDLTVVDRPVVVDTRLDGMVALAKGVNAGEQVVMTGQLRLISGSKVEIAKTAEEPRDVAAKP